MGNIGPVQQRFEVLAIPAFGVEDADRWLLDTVTAPAPESAARTESVTEHRLPSEH